MCKFKGTDDNVEIDRRGQITQKDEEIQSAEQIYNTAKKALKREQYDEAIENIEKLKLIILFRSMQNKVI